eukprot:5083453-Amphidinium_carterae.1
MVASALLSLHPCPPLMPEEYDGRLDAQRQVLEQKRFPARAFNGNPMKRNQIQVAQQSKPAKTNTKPQGIAVQEPVKRSSFQACWILERADARKPNGLH